ncbi:MAG TPA: shikimate kinase [Acidimicrobiales bacterium]|nr:shikimate kinase [Acidimicrobiales bacterium]
MGALRGDLPVALCGFMGVGKTSIGRRVAAALGRAFVDSDALIVAEIGMSIADFFAAEGEARFRQIEAETIASALGRRPPVVLALGGGALGDEGTRALLLEEALLVHLDQPFSELRSALPALRRGRPLLAEATEEEVRALFEARRSLYAVAPVQVTLRRRGVVVAAEQVLAAIGATRPTPTDPAPR